MLNLKSYSYLRKHLCGKSKIFYHALKLKLLRDINKLSPDETIYLGDIKCFGVISCFVNI